MMCRSSQALRLSLGASWESKCLFLEVWQHKVWLAVLDEGLFTDVKESYSGHIL